VGNESEEGGSNASTGNGASAGGARIRADGVERPQASRQTQVSGRPGANATEDCGRWQSTGVPPYE